MSFNSCKRFFQVGFIVSMLLLSGCKNRESMLPGTWSNKTLSLTIKPDRTFSGTANPISFTGSWKLDGVDVVFQPLTINGKSLAELKLKGGIFGIDDLDKPIVMKLDDGGKKMTTDKAKDKTSGPSITVSKQ